ncbi:MAG: Asp23/Gls24 family envelope stress response protein [Streptosporangiaceae bacterium]
MTGAVTADVQGAELLPAPPAALPAEARGRTEISERVVERIASQAVAEAEHAAGAGSRFLGMKLGRDTQDTFAQATARVDGQLATIQLTLSVIYPQPVRQVTRAVRDQVITRVGELTGLDVRQVDIDIASLIVPDRERRRVQ